MTIATAFRIPPDLMAMLKVAAERSDRSMNSQLVVILKAALGEGDGNQPTVRELTAPPSSPSAEVRAVYDHWRKARNKKRANYDILSDQRRKKIQARLKEFSVDDLKQAIDNVAFDPWEGRAQFDDLTVIFRAREDVDRFLEMRTNGAAPKLPPYDAAKAWVLATGWRLQDEDLLDELGRRGFDGDEKRRLFEMAQRARA